MRTVYSMIAQKGSKGYGKEHERSHIPNENGSLQR